MAGEPPLTAEQHERLPIDRHLVQAGWWVQVHEEVNVFAGQEIAVREMITAEGTAYPEPSTYLVAAVRGRGQLPRSVPQETGRGDS